MSRTFRDHELQAQRSKAAKRRALRQAVMNDHLCAYLLGYIGEDGHRTLEHDDKVVQHALAAINRGQ